MNSKSKVKLKNYFKKDLSLLKIECLFSMEKGILSVSYLLNDFKENWSGVPEKNSLNKVLRLEDRKHNLWNETCFELFLRKKFEPSYWELNVAPSGKWNFYQFNSYRSPLIECHEVAGVDMNWSSGESCRLDLKIDFNSLFKSNDSLEMNLTTIIAQGDKKTYWAAKHSKSKPDFHDPDTFAIPLVFE